MWQGQFVVNNPRLNVYFLVAALNNTHALYRAVVTPPSGPDFIMGPINRSQDSGTFQQVEGPFTYDFPDNSFGHLASIRFDCNVIGDDSSFEAAIIPWAVFGSGR
jgi:hypothetical protein